MMKPKHDVLAGKWKQLVGKAKQKWGKLTDDEILRSDGRVEQLRARARITFTSVIWTAIRSNSSLHGSHAAAV